MPTWSTRAFLFALALAFAGCPSSDDDDATANDDDVVDDDDAIDDDDSVDDDDAVDDDDSTADPLDRQTWVDPPEIEVDGDGVLQLRMEVAEVQIGDRRLCLRTWNGAVPGPTIDIAAASSPRQVRLDFTNTLTTEDLQTVGPPGPGAPEYDFNETNLHTHGLHVRPDEDATGTYLADNVLAHHAAGATAQYRFDIDEDEAERGRPHEPGTFWYHPHVHGTTGIQVANGMAGALIVRGDIDSVAGIAEATERIFVMTHIPTGATALGAGETCDESSLSVNDFAIIAAPPEEVQVNGVIQPRIVVPPGQVERWRLIHAGVTQEMNVGLYAGTDDDCSGVTGAPIEVSQISVDGITFHAAQAREKVFLSSGNRADLMVEAPATDGVYCLAYEQPAAPGQPPSTIVIAVLDVDSAAGTPTGGFPSDSDLDASALPLLDCNAAADGAQDLIFSQQVHSVTGDDCDGVPPGGGLGFNINCEEFDHMNPRVLTVNRTEDWTATSEFGDHPFHIHVNPFMVCEGTIDGETVTPHWRDTVMVGESVDLRLRMVYETYTGSFVTHCHKLHHEDQGMMEMIRIDPEL